MKRKSIREFKDTKVSDEKIELLLKAAMQAPSANNQQPWKFIVVKDRDKLNRLSEMSKGAWMLKHAPLAIIPVMIPSDKSPLMRVQDISAATQNILLEAVHQELGAVWIGVHPLPERVGLIKELYQITEDYTPFCIIAIGEPEKDREMRYRYDESRVFYDEWKE